MKVEKYRLVDWEEPKTGLLIDENEEWVLVKHIPVDYVVDGYKLYRKAFIAKRTTGEAELFIAKVLQLKGVKTNKPAGFTFQKVVETLQWSQDRYGLFEFQDQSETELFYGRINSCRDGVLIIDMIKSKGEEEKAYEYEFEIEQIRVITFESDYFESIRLLWQDQKKNNNDL
ncbi:hypothetical protein QNI16_38045 [Cytophagaceae bacterium YF14B1]|uniref:Uncharacterized protein n=1 Tax=Xanthocytophaga flava TaxID=3048013 RepID=A0AAE3UAN6_9BACT|nr:hypothetical protein [Xanthocytophaga flavus]MDJ1486344.1 hypothetical protein [Xanthocytophaga flavus]